MRKLEVGIYPVDKHKYDIDVASNGPALEGIRMSEAVVPTMRIDPTLNVGRFATVMLTPEDAIKQLSDVSKPVLEKRKMIVAYSYVGGDQASSGATEPGKDGTVIGTVLVRFAEASTAKSAAKELEDVDFGVSPDNRRLTSSKFKDALLHWRPGVASIGVYMPYKEFVISLLIEQPRADSKELIDWADKTLTAATAQLDKFQATPADKIGALKADPDEMLARVAVAERKDRKPDAETFASYGPNFLVTEAGDQAKWQRVLDETGTDRYAIADTTFVARTRDRTTAPVLLKELHAAKSDHYDAIDAPRDVPGAKCEVLNAKGDPKEEFKYRCYVSYGRYVAGVNSDREPDVRQRVAAQYALLANSL
ncbi:hypothetical protein [Nocardia sp. NPDC052566]|uniref:DUF7373 family lipoprotein n=1 Tax=Nocardia sp. NPDC052566 TaxID=3364330 RepID=UPI0037CC2775